MTKPPVRTPDHPDREVFWCILVRGGQGSVRGRSGVRSGVAATKAQVRDSGQGGQGSTL